MVSRYGVTKEGAVGVTVGVGAMHCLLPHCGGPHHLSPHGHNPNHNHIHHHNHHNHHNHHPPASQSPHGHLSQLNHAQHQLTININHNHQLQSQQTQHQQQPPPQYRIITASARSDVNFHVPGQNYGGQPGGQVGGGGGSVGVPGGRGPPQIGGIQTIGQSAPGIPQGSQTGAQQPPPQSQTPGVQSQQPQGPPPTTTPPGHTQSPQEMGKQPHLQAQPLPLQPNLYATSQPRPASQVYYSSATRPQAARGNHRGGQGGGGAQVVSIPSVGGGGGQQTAMFPHPASLPMAPGTLYMQSQVPLHPSHSGTHQPPVYSMNNPMQPVQVVFPGPPQRPQGHQSQQFFQTYPPTIIQSNLFGYSSPSPHHAFYYPQQGPQVNLGRPTAGAISGGAPHVGSPLPGGQGANVVQQGSIQQPSQQPQQMQPMALPLVQTDVYQGHNGGVQNPGNSAAARKKQRRKKAILDIVDPKTGKNISEQIYDDDAATQSGDSSNRATPQPQLPVPVPIPEPEPPVAFVPPPSIPEASNISATVQSSSIIATEAVSNTATAPNSNSVPSKEEFPTLDPKISTNSPARRKSHNQGHSQTVAHPVSEASPPVPKEQKERKLSERNLNSRGTTPTPVQNQSDHHHPKPNGDTISEKLDKHDPEPVSKTDQQQQQPRLVDGKATQKQKNKRSHLKNRDLINRKGAEKEGTEMDAFMTTAPSAKPEAKQSEVAKQETQESLLPNDSGKESAKDIKDEENIESKKGAESKLALKIEQAAPEASKENTPVQTPTTEKLPSIVQNNKESSKETTPTIEDTGRIEEVCKMPVKITANDVVDHAAIADDAEIESAIVAQKNEENAKVSALRAPSDEQQDSIPIIEKEDDNNEETDPNKATPKGPAPLKYIYKDDQWSPLNKSGKKVYDRDFLIKLQNDPNSKIKPLNLPDLEVVLKENSRNRGAMDLRQLKDVSLGGKYDFPFAPFGKQSQSMRSSVPPKRGSQQGKPKNAKPVIHLSLSLREDVKLRETENAWKPGRMKGSGATDNVEEDAKTEALYKRVRGVLNKLTPQKFNTLVNQVRALQIDSQEKLQGVIDLVFEKAVDEPSFSVAYALMCKELAMMHVSSSDSKAGKEESNVNFRKLIITRCQMEFEKNTVDETVKAVKLKEIEECTDPEKKKELQAALDEEERRIRVKSVGNIRFIGELFKQGMLTTNIMHRCIRHLLSQIDEENLECLCKLLSTIGKDLESKSQNLSDYFKQMLDIVNRKSAGKVSSRVRFMLQDVIELRLNKWVPRRDDSNPKTMAEIQKEAETERLDTHMNNTPMNTPRKDDRSNDRKRIRGSGPAEEGGWSQPVRSRQQYSVESAKLKNKPPPMDDLQLGNKNMFQWSRNVSAGAPKTVTPNKFAMLENMPSEQDKRSGIPLSGSRSTGPRDYGRPDYKSYDGRNSRNGSQQLSSRSSSRDSSLHDGSRSQSMSMAPPQPIKSIPPQAPTSTPSKPVPSMSEEQLVKKSANILEEYLSDTNINNAAIEVKETFDNSTFANFVREVLNGVVEKSATARKQVSQLMTHLISKNILPLSLYIAGLGEVLDTAEDLVIDIPKIWIYLAELIWYPLAEGVLPFSELKNTMAPLKSKGLAGKLMGELMITLVQEKSPKWIKDKWDQSGLEWSDFLQESESVNDFVKKYKLEFMLGDSISSFGSLSGQLSMEQIHERLRALMANEKENLFDNICSWISANVGERASEPQFIKILMTSILEVSIEPYNTTWKFRPDKFQNLQNLIPRYIDVNVAVLELQCLIAIQEYINKLEHPSGVLLQIIEKLWEDSIISYDAFLAWESNKDPTTLAGKSVAIMALTSFFTSLKEADDESSGDEA
ncbi:eukaryotic translation initiation factor 4 gamma 3-like isoform X8 [Diprion similis]|uniref:eukaryotic translation initiation factor 4 gamma 3-like isoform X8 n=1 Tax=Diprion similis TaxID=362088 RepID=UPI001EF857EB|nr:eukaryotic translation initiation factor 4 gamma 3-like isoform X8 [Diprion similis]